MGGRYTMLVLIDGCLVLFELPVCLNTKKRRGMEKEEEKGKLGNCFAYLFDLFI